MVFQPERAKSKAHLSNLLATDYRGLIVTTIQKFDGIKKNLNKRKNIFVFIDEAHRSQEGNLGNYMRGALPNAKFLGFTGTPIDKTAIGKGTFKVFGKYDPKGYLDKYSIKESIDDGTTVPLYYKLAPQKLRLNKELLEKEFFELVEKEGIVSIEHLNKLLDKSIKLKNFLKADKRIDKIAQYVAEDFKKFVEPLGFKAFLVAVDREACALYKKALNKYLPKEYSKVVYTQNPNRDSKLMKSFYLSEDKEKQLRRDFLSPKKLPKILIVTEKLLTGYDAPILYCMYLDKPLKDHTLLQAIARINRPYDNLDKKKTAGIVLDFVGIFANLKKALKFDSDTIEGAITDIGDLKNTFKKLIQQAKPYTKLLHKKIDDKTISNISEKFADPKERKRYFKLFKQIQDVYEILSPDKFLRDYLKDYQSLVTLYKLIRNIFKPKEKEEYKDLLGKTRILVRQKVNLSQIVKKLPVYKIDGDIIETLKKDKSSDKSKVVNLHRSITIHIQNHIKQEPFLYPISERVDKIINQFEEKQIENKQALLDLTRIAKNIKQSEKEKVKLGLNKQEFGIYWTLKNNGISKDIVNLSKRISKTLKENENWILNKKLERSLRAQLIKILKDIPITKRINLVNYILKIHQRMLQ
jgi:type I restriction enzyme R subunit